MASITSFIEATHIDYPTKVKTKTARKAFKVKLLKGRPETLFADLKNITEVSNLIFFTDKPSTWHAAISAHYPSVEEEEIQDAWQFKFKEVEDSDTVMTTVNVYKNGTVMVQGNFQPFERDFLRIKERAQQERSAPTDNNHTLPETDTTPTENNHTLPETDTTPTDNTQTLTDVFTELSLNPPTPPTQRAQRHPADAQPALSGGRHG